MQAKVKIPTIRYFHRHPSTAKSTLTVVEMFISTGTQTWVFRILFMLVSPSIYSTIFRKEFHLVNILKVFYMF